jgi:hypothetical protein
MPDSWNIHGHSCEENMNDHECVTNDQKNSCLIRGIFMAICVKRTRILLGDDYLISVTVPILDNISSGVPMRAYLILQR